MDAIQAWLIHTALVLIVVGVLIYKMKKDGNFSSLNWFGYQNKKRSRKGGRE